tara:strand:- start:173 stop:637 length:465 start_codon:yes stop_codon:yes gene_type:complete
MEVVTRRPTKGKFKQFNPEGEEDLDLWRDRFVAIGDPTEYEAALQLAGSWSEWQRMKKEWPEFRDKILIDWLAEVEVKLRSDAIREVCAHSRQQGGAAAAKWVAEGKYKPRRAGKPSKAEVQKQAKIQARIDDEVQDDIARVLNTEGLKLVEVN